MLLREMGQNTMILMCTFWCLFSNSLKYKFHRHADAEDKLLCLGSHVGHEKMAS